MLDIEKRVDKQEWELNAIKDSVVTMSQGMSDCAIAMRDLTTQFAVYTEKHDGTERALKSVLDAQVELIKVQNRHSLDIAGMKPTVESIRGLVWRVITASVLGVGGAFTIAFSSVNS
jgi:hypothetical protein